MSPAFKSSGSSTPSAVSRALPRAIAMNLSGSARVERATHGPLVVKPPDISPRIRHGDRASGSDRLLQRCLSD